MANFRHHLSFGCIGTGLLVAPLISAGVVNLPQASMLWLCGSLGSILPDIDSDNAIALDILFTLLGLLGVYTLLSRYGIYHTGIEIMALVFATYTLVSITRILFEKLTVHRGVFHSVLASLFFGLTTCVMAARFYQVPSQIAWMAGVFMCLGTLLHLLLDEIYSVDFMNISIKRSFGSALKLTDFKSAKANIGLILPCLVLVYFAPPSEPFLNFITNAHTYQHLWNHLFPKSWF